MCSQKDSLLNLTFSWNSLIWLFSLWLGIFRKPVLGSKIQENWSLINNLDYLIEKHCKREKWKPNEKVDQHAWKWLQITKECEGRENWPFTSFQIMGCGECWLSRKWLLNLRYELLVHKCSEKEWSNVSCKGANDWKISRQQVQW